MLARTPVSACITAGVPYFDIESVERVNLSVDGVFIGHGRESSPQDPCKRLETDPTGKRYGVKRLRECCVDRLSRQRLPDLHQSGLIQKLSIEDRSSFRA